MAARKEKQAKQTPKTAKATAKTAAAPKTLSAKNQPDTAKPKKQKRKPHATRPTKKEELEIMERRGLVWDLYKATGSLRAVADHLKSKGVKHCSLGTVHADLQYCLDRQHTELGLSVQQHIENEVAIINDVQFTFWRQMKTTGETKLGEDKTGAAKIVLECVEKRAKLRNLYKPTEVKLSADEQLAKLLGISPEELPDDRNS